MNIFERILDCNSWHIIMYMIEDESPNASDRELAAFEKMQDAFKLDEIYAIAHDELGEPEKAKVLRNWMAEQAKKPKFDPLSAD